MSSACHQPLFCMMPLSRLLLKMISNISHESIQVLNHT